MSASEIVVLPVSGAGTTEIVPSSVASTDPPTLGIFQAQVTETAPIIATTSSVPAPASLPHPSTEGQPDSSESEEDTSQFVITPHSSAPDSTASVPPLDP
jgi:hypothetical protein